MSKRKIKAWLIHLYTASGGIVGMFALFAADLRCDSGGMVWVPGTTRIAPFSIVLG